MDTDTHAGAADSPLTPVNPPRLPPEQIQDLATALEPLDHIATGLAAQALAFVLDGEPASVLWVLNGTVEVARPTLVFQGRQFELKGTRNVIPGELLWHPGRLFRNFDSSPQLPIGWIGQANLNARARFYANLDPKRMPLDVLVRLGRLLAAAEHSTNPETEVDKPGAPVPDGLQCLVNDAVFASFNDYQNPARMDLRQTRPAWDLWLITHLLEQEGLDPALALQMVFECRNLEGKWKYENRPNPLLQIPAIAEVMRARPEVTSALPAQLSVPGRRALVHYLGRDPALLKDCAAVFMRLVMDRDKGVRTLAIPHLGNLTETHRRTLLSTVLTQGDSAQRTLAADLLARFGGPGVHVLLETARLTETHTPVQHALQSALTRLRAADDATGVTLPEPPAWTALPEAVLGDEVLCLLKQNRANMLEDARIHGICENGDSSYSNPTPLHRVARYHDALVKLDDDALNAILKALNGQIPWSEFLQNHLCLGYGLIVKHGDQIMALPQFGVAHLIRYYLYSSASWHLMLWHNEYIHRRLPNNVDLRALAQLLEHVGAPLDGVAGAALHPDDNHPTATQQLPPGCVWPFFLAHPQFIEEGLGLIPPVRRERGDTSFIELAATLDTLNVFPTLPARWLPRVLELALGDAKAHRSTAQQILSRQPDIGPRVMAFLTHPHVDVRAEAALWLARLHHTPAIEALTQALKNESRDAVRATFLSALEALGVDLAPHLAPRVLLAEARKGLKAKRPAALAWFPFDALPACHWIEGGAVEPDILRWWVVLAFKLKEPGGNALLTRYLGLLDAASRQALGSQVLKQFIEQDTRHPTLEESIAHAQATAPARWQQYQDDWNTAKPHLRSYFEVNYHKTRDQVFDECQRERRAEYFRSAIGEKGILALAAFAPAHEAVTLLRNYMRDHHTRRTQIEALLDAVASGSDPLVIQFLLDLARRYRTAAVQEKARQLVQQIADRNGWSADQLADRTLPTAGLDDTGMLALHYGERLFTVVLDAALKTELRNPDGKVIKTLPAPRQNDDAEQIKETRAQFQSHKKELKQVIELQTARLYEALCSGRLWPQGEWREHLLRHPIAGRLIQRLVWLEADGSGTVHTSFRPTEDGSLINPQDDEIRLKPDSLLCLGHASRLDADTATAWIRHFKDYKIKELFPQMTHRFPALALKDDAGHDLTEIRDRTGWVSDTFTLRKAFIQRGYQRAPAMAGGFFIHYLKEFRSIGLRVIIEFSGNALPEENHPAALKALRFEDSKRPRWTERTLPLTQVPPVLLAESYADYLAIAQTCAGFNPDWEKTVFG